MTRNIFITARDRQRLIDCLAVLSDFPDKRDLPHIQYLDSEVQRAQVILDPMELPRDAISMRSTATLENVDTGQTAEYTLRYPQENNSNENAVSVLAPLGAAMLGHRVGDTFEVELPRGRTSFRVTALTYQPEAAGDFDR